MWFLRRLIKVLWTTRKSNKENLKQVNKGKRLNKEVR
jgi:hypothetical protein